MFTRRTFLASAGSLAAVSGALALSRFAPLHAAARPLPTRAQLEWQKDEIALFLHFGVNTFTDREWGDGKEDPAIFAPSRLDARQWARTAVAAGAKAMILTAKHHDGFCLWPTKTTAHSVASSPFRGRKGDVVREFVDACREFKLKAGLYLSPWDRNAAVYGDSPRYNTFYWTQLTELLTQYGRIDEVWFDGANGEGPNGKKQIYDWPSTWALVRKLQPDAVMFSDAGPDVRWIGNENGVAGMTNWSTFDPSVVPVPGLSGAAVTKMLREGDPNGSAWCPGETDVSIRPGWFYHPADDAKVRSVENLVNLYFTSVGRNSKLLLNVPPTRDGLLHDIDVERLTGMRARLDEMFASPSPAQGLTTDFGRERSISISELREEIATGQTIAGYTLEGSTDKTSWHTLASGTTIGYCKLDRFALVTVRYVRLTVTASVGPVQPVAARYF
ncbi:MAG: alpha-L-fucosidase [Acidobacteria bacterium]|nr:alpha-L-fucosidase [Acidobacteriota bacterium]